MWTIIVRDTQGAEVARVELQQGPLTIGRDKAQNLVLPSSAVSRKHARIELRNGRPVFLDEGSANGSIVDGKRVVAPVELTERSTIEITPFRLSVQKAEEDDEGRTMMLRRPVVPAAARPTPPAAPQAAPAPPPRPAPPPTPTVVPVPRVTAPAPARAASDWDAAATELERQIQGIRAHRELTETTSQTRVLQLDEDWQKVVLNMQALKTKLSSNPRLMSFDISRDGKEVAVKLREPREKLGYRYFLLSRQHPQGKFASLEAVWLTEIGREDKDYRDARQAMSDLLQRIAATLA